MRFMQAPNPNWNTPPNPGRSSAKNAWMIGLGLLGSITLLFCLMGVFAAMRLGLSDAFSCSSYMTKGEYKKAIPPCRAAALKLPRSGAAHNQLAWCLTLDGQVKEGLVEATMAVALQPNRTHYDTLAMALALSGKSKEAMNIETEHVMVNGSVGTVPERVTLGMVYYASGSKVEARDQWEIARKSTNIQARKLAEDFEAKYP